MDNIGIAFQHREKISVAVLGATGAVGQRFVQLLVNHPWFKLEAVCASERSVGRRYGDVVTWRSEQPLPEQVAQLPILPCSPDLKASIVFSALPGDIAGDIERAFAKAGHTVVSNARALRMDPDVPLLIPEVNLDHLALLDNLSSKGCVVTNPNCAVVGIAMVLKVLDDNYGVEKAQVVTLQALSGAGFPGISAMDGLDNVIPYIAGEEDKIEQEPKKILGKLVDGKIVVHDLSISATANRVSVTDGHMGCVSVKLRQPPADIQEVVSCLEGFESPLKGYDLPSAPQKTFYCFADDTLPQPRRQRHLERGMAVSVGRVRSCPVMDLRFTVLTHNTIRGAAGAAILNAEALTRLGKVFW